MIIEFPQKYTVVNFWGMAYSVTVPTEYTSTLAQILKQQQWIGSLYPSRLGDGRFSLTVSSAYDVTPEQAYDALCRLCEHAMSPVETIGEQ